MGRLLNCATSQKTCQLPQTKSCFREKGRDDKTFRLSISVYSISGSSHLKNFNVMRKFFVVAALFTCSHLFAQQDTIVSKDEVVISATKFLVKHRNTGK